MKEILEETLELLQSGQDFALVRLIAERGSTPRAAGAEMLVRRDGSIAGTIGGGLLELTMMKQAADVLERGRSVITNLGLTGTDVNSDEKMICGGSADVLIAYVAPGDPTLADVCAAARAAVAAQRKAWLFTVLLADEGGEVEYCLLGEDDTLVGARPCEPGDLRAAVGKIAVHGSAALPDGREVLVEALDIPSTVVICGAGHVAHALAPVAMHAGFQAIVLDDREDFASQERFPGAQVVVTPFDEALSGVDVGENSYVVIVTRGHTHDFNVLKQALRTPARYVGLMASKGKRARIYEAMREAGFDRTEMDRVYSPIGLEIGAETPAELAVSIVAQMIKVRAANAA
jgi:xanthine dehydrogenase accessory factor